MNGFRREISTAKNPAILEFAPKECLFFTAEFLAGEPSRIRAYNFPLSYFALGWKFVACWFISAINTIGLYDLVKLQMADANECSFSLM